MCKQLKKILQLTNILGSKQSSQLFELPQDGYYPVRVTVTWSGRGASIGYATATRYLNPDLSVISEKITQTDLGYFENGGTLTFDVHRDCKRYIYGEWEHGKEDEIKMIDVPAISIRGIDIDSVDVQFAPAYTVDESCVTEFLIEQGNPRIMANRSNPTAVESIWQGKKTIIYYPTDRLYDDYYAISDPGTPIKIIGAVDWFSFYAKTNVLGVNANNNSVVEEIELGRLDFTKNVSLINCPNLYLFGNENLEHGWSALEIVIIKNTDLQKLQFRDSPKLSTMDISENSRLSELSGVFPMLSSAVVKDNTSLREFGMYDARELLSLDLSTNTNLEQVEVYQAKKMQSLDISGDTILENLWLIEWVASKDYNITEIKMCAVSSSVVSSISYFVSSCAANPGVVYCNPNDEYYSDLADNITAAGWTIQSL